MLALGAEEGKVVRYVALALATILVHGRSGVECFDLDAVKDKASPLPHMLPSAEEFGRAMEALGIGRGDSAMRVQGRPPRSLASQATTRPSWSIVITASR